MAKAMYIGVDTEVPIYEENVATVAITADNISSYFTVQNDSYYFAGSGNVFTTNNGGKNSTTAKTTLVALQDISNITFDYSYSSEANYDKFTLTVGGTTVENAVSGSTTNKSYTGSLTKGASIVFTYAKDSSQDKNDDKCTFFNMNITCMSKVQVGTETKEIAQKAEECYIGINNVAKKIKKAYIGVNGIARLFFEVKAYEQLVNYTMLYDGSLGDTTLNECQDITGGYVHNSGLSSFWVQSDLSRNTNSLSTSLTSSTTTKGKTGSLVTFSEIDLTQYVKIANRYSFTHTNSSSSYNLLYTIRLVGRDVSCNALGDPVIFTVKNTKDPYMNVDDGDYFITRNVSAFGLSPNKARLSITVMAEYKGTINAYIYALALFKQDNWQEFCTIAGLNSSNYADETALCANSTAIATILSNKEAVEYMIYNCTGSFMAEFVASSTCLAALNNSSYKTIIMANEHWSKFLTMVA